MKPAAVEFDYRIAWRSREPLPGHHRSAVTGAGQDYHARVPWQEAPDPRRLAMRASAVDPFGRVFVHVFNQYSAIPVYALLDFSASMDFVGVGDKLALVNAFLASLAFSAYRTGDPCGLIVAGAGPEPLRFVPATRNAGLVTSALATLEKTTANARGAEGLRTAPALLGTRRALVFLISDFRWPAALLDHVLVGLGRHDVVPVAIRDSAEDLAHAPTGLARVVDNETGAERSLWVRKATRRKAAEAATEHRQTLVRRLRRHHRVPLFLEDVMDRDGVNRYFLR